MMSTRIDIKPCRVTELAGDVKLKRAIPVEMILVIEIGIAANTTTEGDIVTEIAIMTEVIPNTITETSMIAEASTITETNVIAEIDIVTEILIGTMIELHTREDMTMMTDTIGHPTTKDILNTLMRIIIVPTEIDINLTERAIVEAVGQATENQIIVSQSKMLRIMTRKTKSKFEFQVQACLSKIASTSQMNRSLSKVSVW